MLDHQEQLDQRVSKAVDKMGQYVIAPGAPKPPVPFGLVMTSSAFFGFSVGMLIATLVGGTMLKIGAIGAVASVLIALVVRSVSSRRNAVTSDDLQGQVHDLEVEAKRLEAEVARQSGAFDKWEKP